MGENLALNVKQWFPDLEFIITPEKTDAFMLAGARAETLKPPILSRTLLAFERPAKF